ncbi:MAG: hypothetical protein ACLGI6_19235 [Gammaproteobacteria bacterium]
MTTSPAPAPGGLSTPHEIEALADQLTACADALHASIVKSVKGYKGKPVPAADQDAARKLFDDELLLRQRANGMYADAATLVVKSLGKSQQHVLELTAAAAEKIRTITSIAQTAGLVASLLALSGAVGTGHPAAIVTALENLRKHAKAVAALNPPPKTV